MERELVLRHLAACKQDLSARFGVLELGLFGSTARGEATASSDIDVLVAFDGPADSKRYFGVQFYLEDLLGCPVDLVTAKALRPELRPHIERELIPVG
jgi:predicted nucleotidyltransferase